MSDLEYANGRGGVANATRFAPAVQAKRPGLLMSPGSNQSGVEMRDEALRYAALGLVVLVVDQSQIVAGRDRIWTLTSGDREEAIESVIE